jgi:hypothetical protein
MKSMQNLSDRSGLDLRFRANLNAIQAAAVIESDNSSNQSGADVSIMDDSLVETFDFNREHAPPVWIRTLCVFVAQPVQHRNLAGYLAQQFLPSTPQPFGQRQTFIR